MTTSRAVGSRNRRWLWTFAAGLLCGAALGAALGARCLRWDPGAQILLGLLPPHSRNVAPGPREMPTVGMKKQEVIERLGLEQAVVLPGGLPQDKWRWVLDDYNPETDLEDKYGLREIAEVWLIPTRQAGLSPFLSLGFDHTQRLRFVAGGEWILGFPINPHHYGRSAQTRGGS